MGFGGGCETRATFSASGMRGVGGALFPLGVRVPRFGEAVVSDPAEGCFFRITGGFALMDVTERVDAAELGRRVRSTVDLVEAMELGRFRTLTGGAARVPFVLPDVVPIAGVAGVEPLEGIEGWAGARGGGIGVFELVTALLALKAVDVDVIDRSDGAREGGRRVIDGLGRGRGVVPLGSGRAGVVTSALDNKALEPGVVEDVGGGGTARDGFGGRAEEGFVDDPPTTGLEGRDADRGAESNAGGGAETEASLCVVGREGAAPTRVLATTTRPLDDGAPLGVADAAVVPIGTAGRAVVETIELTAESRGIRCEAEPGADGVIGLLVGVVDVAVARFDWSKVEGLGGARAVRRAGPPLDFGRGVRRSSIGTSSSSDSSFMHQLSS